MSAPRHGREPFADDPCRSRDLAAIRSRTIRTLQPRCRREPLANDPRRGRGAAPMADDVGAAAASRAVPGRAASGPRRRRRCRRDVAATCASVERRSRRGLVQESESANRRPVDGKNASSPRPAASQRPSPRPLQISRAARAPGVVLTLPASTLTSARAGGTASASPAAAAKPAPATVRRSVKSVAVRRGACKPAAPTKRGANLRSCMLPRSRLLQ